ncbi:hypothetical protein BHE74_00053720 [Ensete ventricosum]|nr:hypothetical protein BHE74_00053720 [Ensete ventricosum]
MVLTIVLDGVSATQEEASLAKASACAFSSDFVIGLASGSGKLHGLRQPEAMAALPRAGLLGLGPLVTPFAGVPPEEPIGELSNARAEAGKRL